MFIRNEREELDSFRQRFKADADMKAQHQTDEELELALNRDWAAQTYLHSDAKMTLNGVSFRTETDQRTGAEILVAPVVLITEGVHAGFSGAIFYSAEVLSHMAHTWNGRPLPIMHPTDGNGQPIQANSPEAIAQHSVGTLFNVSWEPERRALVGEVWIDVARAHAVCLEMGVPDVVDIITSGRPLEVSTGFFVAAMGPGGTWNGEQFAHAALGPIFADHLALLPGAVGACSWEDGCGVRNSIETKMGKRHMLLANLDIAHEELYYKLCTIVDRMDTAFAMHFVEAVYDGWFVFRQRTIAQDPMSSPPGIPFEPSERMFMQTYEVDPNSGEVQLTGQPQLVRREVSFVPITQQEHPMTTNCKCTEKVQKILSAANSPFAKTDEEWLSTLTEEQLDKLMAPATVVNVQTPEPTLAALLEKADPALRESIERGMQLHQQERANLEQSVLANTTQFTAEELSKMEGSFLRRLASAVARPVRMAAGGMAVHSPAAEEEEGLDSPWIEKKA